MVWDVLDSGQVVLFFGPGKEPVCSGTGKLHSPLVVLPSFATRYFNVAQSGKPVGACGRPDFEFLPATASALSDLKPNFV